VQVQNVRLLKYGEIFSETGHAVASFRSTECIDDRAYHIAMFPFVISEIFQKGFFLDIASLNPIRALWNS
jgi:hypothetical protein